jgi:hypothetical protein
VGGYARKELARTGLCPEKFQLGHSPLWKGVPTSFQRVDKEFP